jgi:ribosomal protein S27E
MSISTQLTERYRMTLAQAAGVPVPCGFHAGEPMGEQSAKEVYWFATRMTSTKTKQEMRDAICAARIIRASRQDLANEERWEKAKSQQQVSLNHAKRVMVECISCGDKQLIPRLVMDRASRPKCWKCGGTLADIGGFVDDFIPASEACEEYNIAKPALTRAALRGQVLRKKEGAKWLYGRSSLEKFLTDQATAQL